MPVINDRSRAKEIIQAPTLAEPLTEQSLPDAIEAALQQRLDIDCAHFVNDEASNCVGSGLEFSRCIFERCVFSNWEFKRLSFVDCFIDHCDLSSLRLENVTFQRVRFVSCRLTGAEFLQAALMNVLFESCTADYFALSESKANRVAWQDCRLRESLWQDVKLKVASFERCDLTSAQLRYMPMEGLDMTTCTLDSIRIDPHDLRGMKVSASQGLMFCSLLGLKIDD